MRIEQFGTLIVGECAPLAAGGMAVWLMSLTRNHQVRGSVPRLGIVVGAISPSTGSHKQPEGNFCRRHLQSSLPSCWLSSRPSWSP